jgi:hypothetical protein
MKAQEPGVSTNHVSAMEFARATGQARIQRWKETPGLADELARAHAAMDAGRKVSQERVEAFVMSRRAAKK